MKVFIINPGATSTKVAVFEEENLEFKKTIEHEAKDLAPFETVIAQREYRRGLIEAALAEAGYSLSDFDAICGRGGLLRHIPSGTYLVTDQAVYDIENATYGEHASNLGALLARELGDKVGIPAFFVDPVCTDEMTELARVSGFAEMQRESFFHALNHKSMARKAAALLKKPYETLNLIVCHMGGGVSVAAHEKGRAIDLFNVRDEGAFSMDRGGSLPIQQLIDYCFSGRTKQEVRRTFTSQAGVYSYLGTRDFRTVEDDARAGDEKAELIGEAMAYQLSKDMGAMAAVMRYEVDAIVLTGGMANSQWLCDKIKSYMEKLCPILVLPGEEEMQSLANGALRVLHGEKANEY